MSFKILIVVGLLIPTITARRYSNESWKSLGNARNQCWKAAKDFPSPTLEIASNSVKSFEVYILRLADLANYENNTLLSTSAAMMINILSPLESIKGAPENLLFQFNKILPNMSAELRQVVSLQECNIGKLTDLINDDIKRLELSLKRILDDFLRNGISNLGLGKKTDVEPVMTCLQKLTNKIAKISETTLNDLSLSNDGRHGSLIILAIILNHWYVIVQGTESTIATITHLRRKYIPPTLSSCLNSTNASILRLTESIQSTTDLSIATVLTLLRSILSLNDFINTALKSIFGVTTGAISTVEEVTDGLSSGISSITQGLIKLD